MMKGLVLGLVVYFVHTVHYALFIVAPVWRDVG